MVARHLPSDAWNPATAPAGLKLLGEPRNLEVMRKSHDFQDWPYSDPGLVTWDGFSGFGMGEQLPSFPGAVWEWGLRFWG